MRMIWMTAGTAGLLCGLGLSTQLFAQSPATVPAQTDEYVVRAGDVLRIRVWPDSTLGGEFAVEETGLVYLPILAPLRAAGVSIETLRQDLRAQYGEQIRTPVITITPLFTVSVIGAVLRPGLFQVDPTQTLFDVISLAGGFRPDAKDEDLRVLRGGGVLQINAEQALETGGGGLSLALQSGDRVVIPQETPFNWSTLLNVSQLLLIMAGLAVQVSR
jgi:polysaccharide export outer membrane protein